MPKFNFTIDVVDANDGREYVYSDGDVMGADEKDAEKNLRAMFPSLKSKEMFKKVDITIKQVADGDQTGQVEV